MGTLTYQVTEPLSNDWHTVQVQLMNAYKNHNLPRKLLFQVAPPPAFAFIRAMADTIIADGVSYVPLDIEALDADGLALADGTEVSIMAEGATLESPTVTLNDGRGVAYLHSDVTAGKATVRVPADSTSASTVIHFTDTDYAILEGEIFDALTEKPLPEAQIEIEGQGSQLAEDGRFFFTKLRTAPLWAWVSSRGHFDFSTEVDLRKGRASVLDVSLYPVDQGVLFDQSYILDPQFGGSEFGDKVGDDVDAADLNLQVCQHLRDYLEAAGAQVIMLRDKDVYVSTKERVLQTNEAEKGWYLRIEHRQAEGKSQVVAYSATADEYAKQLGRAVLEPLARFLDLQNGGLVNTGDYEIVQANKNALSVAFMTIGPGALNMDAANPILLQREAYALYRGIAAHNGLEKALDVSLELRVVEAQMGRPIKGVEAAVDGVLRLSSDTYGEIRFHGLGSREYRVQLKAEGYHPAAMVILAGTGETVQVQLAPES
jgi:hypothetical protein